MSIPTPELTARTAFLRHAGALLAIAGLGALVYGAVGGYGYSVVDDPVYITQNRWVQEGLTLQGTWWAFSNSYASNWHPLTWLSHMLDSSLFGPGAGPRHVVSVAIHLFNAGLLYLLAFRLFRHAFAGAAAALVFVVHPLHVESVVWISERKDVLCGLFVFAALNTYLVYCEGRRKRWYLATFLLFVLALLSKPMAVTFPVQLLLLDWLVLERLQLARSPAARAPGESRRALVEKLPFFAVSLVVGLVTVLAQDDALQAGGRLPAGFRIVNATVSYATYLRDFLLPTQLAALYPVRSIDFLRQFLPALLLLGALAFATFRVRKRTRWPLFALLWFLVTLLPVIGLLQVGGQSHADRYMYISAAGFYLGMAAAVAGLPGVWRPRAVLLTVPVILYFTLLGWIQVGYWASPHKLWTRTLEVAGDTRMAHTVLYDYYVGQNRYEQATLHATALATLYPDTSAGASAMGWIEYRQRRFGSAETWFRRALEKEIGVFPVHGYNLQALAMSIEQQNRPAEALQYYREALNVDPNLVESRRALRRLNTPD